MEWQLRAGQKALDFDRRLQLLKGTVKFMIKKIFIGLLALVSLIAGYFGGRELARSSAADEATQAAEAHALEVAGLKNDAVAWATAVSKGEGEAILRAFVAGISPSLLAERREGLEISAIGLLRVAGVEGIHLLHPDGKVLYSSDAKLATTGDIGERGAWALGAQELISRQGNHPGSLDFAVPLISTGQVIAIIWLEYGESTVREAARPAGLSSPSTTATAPAPQEPATPPATEEESPKE